MDNVHYKPVYFMENAKKKNTKFPAAYSHEWQFLSTVAWLDVHFVKR